MASALPHAEDPLSPNISEQTIEFHYAKRHKSHVDNLNNLIIGSEFERKSLGKVMKLSEGSIFGNVAEMRNHSFCWRYLTPNSSMRPTRPLAEAINETFGSFSYIKEEFTRLSLQTFGSGWGWLVKANDGRIELTFTAGAENPMVNEKIPLLTCDVWEHAYHIDCRNAPLAYAKAFLELVNWEHLQARYMETT